MAEFKCDSCLVHCNATVNDFNVVIKWCPCVKCLGYQTENCPHQDKDKSIAELVKIQCSNCYCRK